MPTPKKPSSSSPQPRKRARNQEGQFKGDNPLTPGVNEAWEPTEVEAALPKKENPYAVKQKVDGLSSNTAGKYAKKAPVTKPGIGNVSTTSY